MAGCTEEGWECKAAACSEATQAEAFAEKREADAALTERLTPVLDLHKEAAGLLVM